MYTTQSHNAGFSLIELLVSITIFSVVVTMSIGTLLVLIDANAKAQNIQTVMTNLTFALDSMTREIRTGSNYFCENKNSLPNTPESESNAQDCTGGENFLSIVEGGTNQASPTNLTNAVTGNRIEYYFDDDFFGTGNGALLRRLGDDTTGSNNGWYPITSEAVKIESLVFYVSGSDKLFPGNDVVQPSVTVLVRGNAGNFSETDATYTIETTVGQRLLDI